MGLSLWVCPYLGIHVFWKYSKFHVYIILTFFVWYLWKATWYAHSLNLRAQDFCEIKTDLIFSLIRRSILPWMLNKNQKVDKRFQPPRDMFIFTIDQWSPIMTLSVVSGHGHYLHFSDCFLLSWWPGGQVNSKIIWIC